MTDLDFLKHIEDGLKVYLRPVGLLPNALLEDQACLSFGGSGMAFSGAVLHWRNEDRSALSHYVGAETLFERVLPQVSEQLATDLKVQIDSIAAPSTTMSLANGRTLAFNEPIVMGVLNVTPDSFSDGGKFLDAEAAVQRGRAMIAAGANIIDIGGESTRPGAEPVWEGDELDRVIPVIEALSQEAVTLSVDTRRAAVMKTALQAGAHIINDVSALTYDEDSLEVVANAGVPVVLMHAQGDPRTMQDDPSYDDVLLDVYDYLQQRVEACVEAGIACERLIIDPGIGFGKRLVQDNSALINGLSLFHTLGCPVLLGASRKRFIGAVTGVDSAELRLAGSLASNIAGLQQGAHILRVHDVAETRQAVTMFQAFKGAAMIDAAHQRG